MKELESSKACSRRVLLDLYLLVKKEELYITSFVFEQRGPHNDTQAFEQPLQLPTHRSYYFLIQF